MANIYCAFPWGLALSQEFYLYPLISSSRQPPEAGTAVWPILQMSKLKNGGVTSRAFRRPPRRQGGWPRAQTHPSCARMDRGHAAGDAVTWQCGLTLTTGVFGLGPVAVRMVTSCMTLRPPRKLSGPQFAHPRNGDSSTVLLTCWRRKWRNKGWEQFLS